MDIKKMESVLRMEDLYFSYCSVERDLNITEDTLEINLDREIEPLDDLSYDVQLDVSVKNANLKVFVSSKAKFIFTSDPGDMRDKVVKNNTVAIMFPFVRSQITLLTSQPGMQPVIIPPINTAKFI
ncbi:MAG: protein-export chaperone SecB [Clostridiales bacterium]|nr:protein-export chaperone SecB [Clostridiales bacterium]MCC8107002.1 protein-export chaperone SecB [Clostridiales bacterium]